MCTRFCWRHSFTLVGFMLAHPAITFRVNCFTCNRAARRGHKEVVDSLVMLPTETVLYNNLAVQKCVMTKNDRGRLASLLTRSTSIYKQLRGKYQIHNIKPGLGLCSNSALSLYTDLEDAYGRTEGGDHLSKSQTLSSTTTVPKSRLPKLRM